MADPLIVNKGELGRLFRVSLPTIDAWVSRGCPVRSGGSNGVPYEFDFEAVKAWREQEDSREREAEAERRRRIDLAQAEMFDGARLAPDGVGDIREALEAERLALIVGKQKGELVSREDVRADYAAIFGVIRQHMLGWAATLTRSAGLTPDQQKEADRLVRETLVALHGQIKDPDLRPKDHAV
ncbi:MAG: terminase small subunit [Reyranellaceae bacterium]